MEGDTGEPTSPFLCREAIGLLCSKSHTLAQPIWDEFVEDLDVPLLEACKKHLSLIYCIVLKCNTKVLIAARYKGRKNNQPYNYKTLYDFRYNIEPTLQNDRPPLYLLLDASTQALILSTCNTHNNFPTCNFNRTKENFFVSDSQQKPPQSLQEVRDRLAAADLLQGTNVFYRASTKPLFLLPWCMGYNYDTDDTPMKLMAFVKPDLSIGYRQMKDDSRNKVYRNPFEEVEKVRSQVPNPNKKNRKTAVQVVLTALNLAVCLGICSHQERVQMGEALSKLVGALWISYDEKHQARHVVYRDCLTNTGTRQELQQGKTDDSWDKIFARIDRSRQLLMEKKYDILAPLLKRLEAYQLRPDLKLRSKWQTCAEQLKQAINRHRVLLFSDDDTALHTIKVPLAGYFPKNGGARLHALANNSVTALSCKGFLFVNLADAFDFKSKNLRPDQDDDVLWELAEEWSVAEQGPLGPPPMLESTKKTLKSHKSPLPKVAPTMISYLYQRGERNADAMIRLWTALVSFNSTHFNYDLASIARSSQSKQAFDILWIDYTLKAGPMAHAIEKMHSHAEFTLRPFCEGGFSYSCEDEVVQGKPLHKDRKSTCIATSIHEYDLTSSYGFSGMSMAAGKGFGHIFPYRDYCHTSFEYMAVMYTLYKWTTEEQLNIVSVFSNFSPLGVMKLGAYPIDLVVVLACGAVRLFQVDGHYVHGDYNNECPNYKSYIGGATREEVETKTRTRDVAILSWVGSIGIHGTSYTVVTDCCHPEYSPDALKTAFATIPALQALVSGLDQLDGTLECADPNEMTFLAVVRCTPEKEKGNKWSHIFDSKSLKEGRILLTQDYYQYLKQHSALPNIDEVEWIIYYKRCRDLPRVFQNLLQMRQYYSLQKSKAGVIKGIINRASGFFGLNLSTGTRTISRITPKAPRNFNIFKHAITPLFESYKDTEFFMIKTYYAPPKNPFACPTPLPLFVSIVEYGKLRLNQAIQVLQSTLMPNSFRLLYSNVDNLIVAFATDTPLEAFRTDVSQLHMLIEAWNGIFASSDEGKSEPGMMKLEWSLHSDHGWKFVSPFPMFYSAVTVCPDADRQKTCSFKGLGTHESYQFALDMLDKKTVEVQQTRRVNKLAGPEVKNVSICYKPND